MQKIAILRRNGLGDLLCTYPLILHLRQKFPDSAITLFVDERNASLIPFLPPIDELVVFPKKGNKYWNLMKIAMAYRGVFDLAISAKTSPMKLANLFLFWLGAKQRIAYVDQHWHRWLINSPLQFVEAEAKGKHQALKGLQMIAPEYKEVPQEYFPTLHLPQTLKEQYSFSFAHPLVLITGSTTRESNRFDASRYAELINRLYAEFPVHVLITGQEQDRNRAEEIAAKIHAPNTLHFPRSFEEFMVLLDLSDLYFVGDGGVAHIGAALGKSGVILYGETNPVEWGPMSQKMGTFYHPEHVNRLSDEEIFRALKRKMEMISFSRLSLK